MVVQELSVFRSEARSLVGTQSIATHWHFLPMAAREQRAARPRGELRGAPGIEGHRNGFGAEGLNPRAAADSVSVPGDKVARAA
eukprot:gene255-biopygen8859